MSESYLLEACLMFRSGFFSPKRSECARVLLFLKSHLGEFGLMPWSWYRTLNIITQISRTEIYPRNSDFSINIKKKIELKRAK